MKIVLDTNVLVSALLSPHGPPADVLRTVLSQRVQLCFDARILQEYGDVLARERFGFDAESVEELLAFLEATGEPVIAQPLSLGLPDPWDETFIEVASAGDAACLVTGNGKHFPERRRAGVVVLSPREFLNVYSTQARE